MSSNPVPPVIPNQPPVTTTPPVTTPPVTVTTIPPSHTSWLHKFGVTLGRILGFVAVDAKPIADKAAVVATLLLPQFSGEIQVADNIVSRIAAYALAQEGVAQSVTTQAATGTSKLAAVTSQIGPEIDAWITANFAGAAKASDLEKQGLVQAVVNLINKPTVVS